MKTIMKAPITVGIFIAEFVLVIRMFGYNHRSEGLTYAVIGFPYLYFLLAYILKDPPDLVLSRLREAIGKHNDWLRLKLFLLLGAIVLLVYPLILWMG